MMNRIFLTICVICSKGTRKVGELMRLRNLIPTLAKLRIYKAFILPQITYCHIVWHQCRSSDDRKVEQLQQWALRAIYYDTSSSYEEFLKKANLPSLHNCRLQDIAILMFKAKNNLVPTYILELFNCNMGNYSLRN
jgi:hypothetical protein